MSEERRREEGGEEEGVEKGLGTWECNNRPKYQQMLLGKGYKVGKLYDLTEGGRNIQTTLTCRGFEVGILYVSRMADETFKTHLQRIEGGLRLDGDGESTSSTVSVTVRSL